MLYNNLIDSIFINIANDYNLDNGDFTFNQEVKFDKIIKEFLDDCNNKKNNKILKKESKLENYSYLILKKIALKNNLNNYKKNGRMQKKLISLLNEYINQNIY